MDTNIILKKPELLAPAGSFENMKAAISAGADAVYMGGKSFGARAYAENPDESGVIEAIRFCHIRNKKLYLTVNTMLKEDELKNTLYDYLKPYYEAGLDAVIVQDIGVMEFIGKHFPGLDIHVSTQCSLTMAEGIKGLTSMLTDPGSVTRIVPARELSLNELKQMRQSTDLEMEVFIHGALCYCYSGQCLLSSLAGGRSGNRGRCAQPCRKLYKAKIEDSEYKGYFLSPKDMCTLEHIPELIEAGVDSFKIEGRMKSAEYGAGVVAAYRRAIDRYFEKNGDAKEIPGEIAGLSEIYNRGGFNTGYLYAHNGQDMMSTLRPGHFGVKVGEVYSTSQRKALIKAFKDIKHGDVLEIRADDGTKVYEFTCGTDIRPGASFDVLTMKDRLAQKGMKVFRTRNQSLLNEIDEKYIKTTLKQPVDIKLICKKGEALTLTMSALNDRCNGQVSVTVTGNIVEEARNAASTKESLENQVGKLGNTDFTAGNISVDADGAVFVPVGELNRLRREAAEQLREKLISFTSYKEYIEGNSIDENEISPKNENIHEDDALHFSAYVKTFKQLSSLVKEDRTGVISDIYFEIDTENTQNNDEMITLCKVNNKKPYLVLPRVIRADYYKKIYDIAGQYVAKCGFIASNYEAVYLLKELNADFRTDYNIYAANICAIKSIGVDFTIPYELNAGEIEKITDGSGEMVIYGLLSVMISAQCLGKTATGECKYRGLMKLTDEKGYTFTIHQECKYCYNVVYNSAVLNLIPRLKEVRDTGCNRFGLRFTFEDESEIRLILKSLEYAINDEKYAFPDEIMGMKMTNGHFLRGVE
ncbi:MAG: U32 family peptidase [Lachnospiraceae bacterium]|nr:U32 family peptidase [Lachnospiraceae bacterium]